MESDRIFRIVVLEDNEFYNKLLTKQLQNYTGIISAQKNLNFDIQSYTSPVDFIDKLNPDTDIAFVDYYLGNSVTGMDIIKQIREKCKNCKIIIISQVRTIKTAYQTLEEGAMEYIFKDSNALAKSCFVLEDVLNASINDKV